MKTILTMVFLLVAATASAETQSFAVIPWEEPFHPQYFLYNRDLGTVYGMEGGTVNGPTRILPNPGERNPVIPPVLPQSRPQPTVDWNYMMQSIDAMTAESNAELERSQMIMDQDAANLSRHFGLLPP